MPDSRNAGSATIAPTIATMTIATTSVTRFPLPGSLDMAMAPSPANVSGANDIWPA